MPKAARCTWPTCATRRDDFEPLSRDRFLAGALLPAAWYVQAQRVRRCYRDAGARALFETSTSCWRRPRRCAAPPIGTEWFEHQRPAPAGCGRAWAC